MTFGNADVGGDCQLAIPRFSKHSTEKFFKNVLKPSFMFTIYSWLPPSKCDYWNASLGLITRLAHANPAH